MKYHAREKIAYPCYLGTWAKPIIRSRGSPLSLQNVIPGRLTEGGRFLGELWRALFEDFYGSLQRLFAVLLWRGFSGASSPWVQPHVFGGRFLHPHILRTRRIPVILTRVTISFLP